MCFQKVPVPSVECPVCNIQLSSQQVYVTHVEGKAHKKKLIQREKEKAKGKEPEKVEKEEIVSVQKITPQMPLKGNNDVINAIVPNNDTPTLITNVSEHLHSASSETIIIQPPSGSKKKKKNKVSL